VCGLAVAAGEGIWEDLGAHTVDGTHIIAAQQGADRQGNEESKHLSYG
jgi:hypothetical protein